MKLGILETGAPPSFLRERFGAYPEMFRSLLGDDGIAYRVFAVAEGDLPRAPQECDGYIVTGSACGVYDPLPWILELKGFLNAASGKAALVGVCFGHQVMADAFGGEVVKSPKGWGLGEHEYEVLSPKPWMDSGAPIRLPASHQDQVVAAPPGAEVIAASDFTPFGALAYPERRAISMQLHPEFEPAYAIALIEARRGKRYSEDEAERAISSYQAPDDRARVGGWIRNFLVSATS